MKRPNKSDSEYYGTNHIFMNEKYEFDNQLYIDELESQLRTIANVTEDETQPFIRAINKIATKHLES